MDTEEMIEMYNNGEYDALLNYIFGDCRKGQLVALVRALNVKQAQNLEYMIDAREDPTSMS